MRNRATNTSDKSFSARSSIHCRNGTRNGWCSANLLIKTQREELVVCSFCMQSVYVCVVPRGSSIHISDRK